MYREQLYNTLAAGGWPDDGARPAQYRRNLLAMARDASSSDDREDRIGALRVSVALNPDDTLVVATDLIHDPDDEIRGVVLRMAIGAHDRGIPLLLTLAADKHVGIAQQAMLHLVRLQSQNALHISQELLGHHDATLRRFAAELIGLVGGKSSVVSIRRALETEEDPAAIEAMYTAEAQLTEGAPKPRPQHWWTEGAKPDFPAIPKPTEAGTRLPSPPTAVDSPTVADPPASDAPDALDAIDELALLADDEEEDGFDPDLVPTPVPAPTREEPPRHPTPAPAPDPAPPSPHGAGGFEGAEDREAALGAALRKGGEARAAALHFIAEHQLTAWLTQARSYASDTDHAVRAAAAGALGTLGGPAVMPALRNLIEDAQPGVQLAAIAATVKWAQRLGRHDMARSMVQGASRSTDPEVKAAAEQANGQLQ